MLGVVELFDLGTFERLEVLRTDGFALRLAPLSTGFRTLLIAVRKLDARMNERIVVVRRRRCWGYDQRRLRSVHLHENEILEEHRG